jgi:hypothetical protein
MFLISVIIINMTSNTTGHKAFRIILNGLEKLPDKEFLIMMDSLRKSRIRTYDKLTKPVFQRYIKLTVKKLNRDILYPPTFSESNYYNMYDPNNNNPMPRYNNKRAFNYPVTYPLFLKMKYKKSYDKYDKQTLIEIAKLLSRVYQKQTKMNRNENNERLIIRTKMNKIYNLMKLHGSLSVSPK